MKKFTIIILLGILSLNLLGQERLMLLDSIYEYNWDSNIGWILTNHTTYSYDFRGNQVEEISYYWDSDLNEWIASETITSEYNAESKIVETTGKWERHVYSHDDHGDIVEEIRYWWDTLTNEWIERPLFCPWGNCWTDGCGGRILYSYNSYGNANPLTDVDFNFNRYSYGNADTITYFDWVTTINDWIYYLKRIFSFNDDGYVTEGIEYRWDNDSGKWNLDGFRWVYEYNNGGKLIKATGGGCQYEFNNCTENWYYTFEYDLEGRLIEILEFWHGSGEWEPGQRYEFNYDMEGNLEEKLSYSYDQNEYGYKENYYWSEFNASTETNYPENQFRIYPNPSNNLLTIEIGNINLLEIQVNSLNGELIFSKEMEGTSHQIDLSSFKKGIYFITIRSKEFVTTRKIVKL